MKVLQKLCRLTENWTWLKQDTDAQCTRNPKLYYKSWKCITSKDKYIKLYMYVMLYEKYHHTVLIKSNQMRSILTLLNWPLKTWVLKSWHINVVPLSIGFRIGIQEIAWWKEIRGNIELELKSSEISRDVPFSSKLQELNFMKRNWKLRTKLQTCI